MRQRKKSPPHAITTEKYETFATGERVKNSLIQIV